MKKVLTLLLALFMGAIALTGCSNSSLDDETKSTDENIATDTKEEEALSLSEAFSFLNNSSSNYIKVRKQHGYSGIAPGSLNEIYYSDSASNIEKVLVALDQKAIKTKERPAPGADYIEYRFYSNGESYDLIYISDNLIRYNEAYYSLTKPYDIELDNTGSQIYSLVTFDDSSKVYKNNEYKKDFNKVGELEFVKTDTNDKKPLVTIDCTLFKLYVISKNEFYMENSDSSKAYYKLVGDVDFSSIIA